MRPKPPSGIAIAFATAMLMGAGRTPLPAQGSPWQVRIEGVIMVNTVERVAWYDSASPEEFACNAIEGPSPGVRFSVRYAVTERLDALASAGVVRASLHAEVHRTSLNQFAKPKEALTYLPLSVGVRWSLLRTPSWDLHLGPDLGLGIFGRREVVPEFGRARLFSGKNALLLGAQAGADYAPGDSGVRVFLSLEYFTTTFQVQELDTGLLAQELKLRPFTFGLGLAFPL